MGFDVRMGAILVLVAAKPVDFCKGLRVWQGWATARLAPVAMIADV
jgi:hypothetical protein